jgi:uncharacterized NAD-dependent epimerase/dehydratase family protein
MLELHNSTIAPQAPLNDSIECAERAGLRYVADDERFPIPPLREVVELHERSALIARPARVAGIALNTRELEDVSARRAIEAAEDETGLPAGDPVRFGAESLVDALTGE